MKGPLVLSRKKRFSLYNDLVKKPLSFSEKDLALFVQNARLDPRLAEVVTEHLRDYWWKYDGKALNKRLKAQPWPSAIKPMLFQILELCSSTFPVDKEFRQWSADVLAGIETKPLGLYFVLPLRPRSPSFDREVSASLPSFTRAGFFAKDKLFNKGLPGEIKPFPRLANRRINTEEILKIDLLLRLRKKLNEDQNSKIYEKLADRTTRSKIKLGKLDQLSIKTLSKVLDGLN